MYKHRSYLCCEGTPDDKSLVIRTQYSLFHSEIYDEFSKVIDHLAKEHETDTF